MTSEGVTHNIRPTTTNVSSYDQPALSQIACLGGPAEDVNIEEIPVKNLRRKDETSFVKLCREGGHKDLLRMDEQVKNTEAIGYERKGGDWYYQDEISENGQVPVLSGRSNIRDTDSEFVKLSKKGGHEGLLRIETDSRNDNPFEHVQERFLQKEDRISPSTCPPAGTKPADVNVVPGNPIWLGGSGPEMGFVPGKRFMKKDLKESPFAVSSEWMGPQPRNPDKI
ncbi:uncharacterized protein LOC124452428 [Xenia sp. Carnegie-2017]|uniref:uncharacterized protein LOC124452428 n=1 Tax=Xenia sp. Carnegie-2017 TaxID=2897299 RepID=UPI001F03913B|nr:uncharacterized protein LOC124452428 [Xenia sp. Carnegie-2017]